MNKSIVFLALVVFIVFEVYYLLGPSSPNPDIQAVESQTETNQDEKNPSDLQEQTIQQFHIVDVKNQKKELDLWAAVAHKAMGITEWKMEDVKAQFYSEASTYLVVGKNGKVDEVNKSMQIDGNVKLTSSNGYVFYTDRLDYDPITRKITTIHKISVEGPPEKDGRLYLEGIGLDVNMQTNAMVIPRSVKGYKPMSNNRVMHISSERAEVSGQMKSVIFKNNVLMKVDAMRVRGNYAKFQYRDNRLDTLYMDGGIHMQDQDKSGSSGEALVYFNEDKYILRKKPFLTQNNNELIGDEVIIFDGGKRVQVKNAKIEYHKTESEE